MREVFRKNEVSNKGEYADGQDAMSVGSLWWST